MNKPNRCQPNWLKNGRGTITTILPPYLELLRQTLYIIYYLQTTIVLRVAIWIEPDPAFIASQVVVVILTRREPVSRV